MAPNKKKKKAVSNPARGFATTSIASKPKREKQDTIPEMASLQTSASMRVDSTSDSTSELLVGIEDPKKLHHITPEDFEEQLEESELQVLAEKHASICKRQSARQVSKLQTDLRLLRAPAEPLNARKWLPPEEVEQILCLVRQDIRNGSFRHEPANIPKPKVPRQEDLIIKLWVLKLVLLALGFPEQRVREALQQVLENVSVTGDPTPTSKETMWGLPQALDWLALACDQAELPDYDGRQQETSTETPQTSSGTNTPIPNSTGKRGTAVAEEASGALQPDPVPQGKSSADEADEKDTLRNIFEHAEPKNHVHVSDQESDLEPEELVSSYLLIKSQLYDIQPHSARQYPRKAKKHMPQRSDLPTNENTPSPESERLLNKLKKIESDVLFDRHEADAQWAEKRIKIEQDSAKRRKLGLQPVKICSTAVLPLSVVNETFQASHETSCASPQSENANTGADGDGNQDGGDEVGMLGELFASLPETLVDPLTGSSSMVKSVAEDHTITIREFGKWNGMNPRRVLEEACRSRYVSLFFPGQLPRWLFRSSNTGTSQTTNSGHGVSLLAVLTGFACQVEATVAYLPQSPTGIYRSPHFSLPSSSHVPTSRPLPFSTSPPSNTPTA
jgi:ATP-dependent RNA helicase DHX29